MKINYISIMENLSEKFIKNSKLMLYNELNWLIVFFFLLYLLCRRLFVCFPRQVSSVWFAFRWKYVRKFTTDAKWINCQYLCVQLLVNSTKISSSIHNGLYIKPSCMSNPWRSFSCVNRVGFDKTLRFFWVVNLITWRKKCQLYKKIVVQSNQVQLSLFWYVNHGKHPSFHRFPCAGVFGLSSKCS